MQGIMPGFNLDSIFLLDKYIYTVYVYHTINVTTHVVRLKVPEKHDCRTLAEKQPIFTPNMASKCAVFPLFLTVFNLQSIHLSSYQLTVLIRVRKGNQICPEMLTRHGLAAKSY